MLVYYHPELIMLHKHSTLSDLPNEMSKIFMGKAKHII